MTDVQYQTLTGFAELNGGIVIDIDQNETRVFRARLDAYEGREIQSITVTDLDGSGSFQYTGFDLDALLLRQGPPLAAAPQLLGAEGLGTAADLEFIPGDIEVNRANPGQTGAPLLGTRRDGEGLEIGPEALLGGFGEPNEGGVLSLGRGGSLTLTFERPVPVTPDLWLYVGEWASQDDVIGPGGDATVSLGLVPLATSGNRAPELASPLPDRSAVVDTPFRAAVPNGTVSDPDGDPLDFSVEAASLPEWLGFDPATRTFAGTPPEDADPGPLTLTVQASDGQSPPVADSFELVILPPGQTREVTNADAQDIAFLYEGALDRDGVIDEGGLNFWIERFGAGLEIETIAARFLESPEFTEGFGPIDGFDAAGYVDTLYENLLDRAPDPGGFAFWLNALETNLAGDRETLLLRFTGSPENRSAADLEFIETLGQRVDGVWRFGRTNEVTVQGDASDERLIGGAGPDTILAGAGDDTVSGGTGRDFIDLQTGDDLFLDEAEGGANGSDFVKGNFGDDELRGGGGDDVLAGNGGNDTVIGGPGDDLIQGGIDDDVLTGGPGDDTFLFGVPDEFNLIQDFPIGDDLITDFTPGQDRIRLEADDFIGPVLLDNGALSPDNFRQGPAEDGDDLILQIGDGLFFDPDGNGPAEPLRFATVDVQLTEADFEIFIF